MDAKEAKSVMHYAVEEQVKFVDLRFTDLPGSWHHLTFPIGQFSESTFEEGLGFDGSPVAHMWRTMIWPNNFL